MDDAFEAMDAILDPGPLDLPFGPGVSSVEQGDRELMDKQRRCLAMEENLLSTARRIPVEPKTAWEFFCVQRMQEISNAAQSSGEYLSEGRIRHQLAEEFSAVPDGQRQALDQRGVQDLNTHMESVINTMNQLGSSYLQLCQEVDKPPHEELIPVIHLSCHSTARATEEAQQRQAAAEAAAAAAAAAAVAAGAAGAAAGANNENTTEVKRTVKLPPDDLYVSVACNNVTATLHPASCRVRAKGEEMSATHFEQYAGCGSAKKWRASVKLVPGQVPECPEGAPPMQVGKWFEIMGWATSGTRSKSASRKTR